MQTRNFLLLIFTCIGGLALLTSCASHKVTAAGTVNYPVVRIHVTGDEDQPLKITTAANNACAGNQPNCIDVPEFDKAVISFVLTPRAKWRFSEFKICTGTTKDNQVCVLNAYQQQEFEASADGDSPIRTPGANGQIELKQLYGNDINDAFTAFQVLDHNWVAGNYFYSITVCPTGAPDNSDLCVMTDPPIINGGLGGRGGGN
jgi:hypothetical protein